MREFIVEIYTTDEEVFAYFITTNDDEGDAVRKTINKFTYNHLRSDIAEVVIRVM